jgi:hypothetical protein
MASIIKANQLQDFGGNSIITSDGAGNLTTQKINYPMFSASISSNFTLTNATTMKITGFDTEEFDTNNAFSTSDARFTVPAGYAGKYFLSTTVRIGTGSNTTSAGNRHLYKNGADLASTGIYIPASPFQHLTITTAGIFDLAEGDYIEVYGRIETTNSSNGNAYSAASNFSGMRVGS